MLTNLSTGFVQEKIISAGTIIRQTDPAGTERRDYRSAMEAFVSANAGLCVRRNSDLLKAVRKCIHAYAVDGMVRQIVDKHSEQFKDFSFKGEDEVIKCVEDRLMHMSLRTGENWKTTFTRAIDEYFKCGNAFLFKLRGAVPDVERPLYRNKPWALAGLRLVSADRLEPKKSKKGYKGWTITDLPPTAKYAKLSPFILDQKISLDRNQALISVEQDIGKEEQIYLPGLDFCHMAYHRGADTDWGAGMTMGGLEDISILRALESTFTIMLKKNATPRLHHIVGKHVAPGAGIQNEMDKAVRMHQHATMDGGVWVTGPHHEIKPIGLESQAIRGEGYLDFFLTRACVSLGGSPELIGLKPSNLGTGQMAQEKLMARVRYCQAAIAREIEMFVLWEILYECGFDPYSNPDDRVFLEFTDIDEDRMIKLQTHAADLHTKNAIDSEQMGDISRGNMGQAFKKDPKYSKMYTNMHAIPVKKAGPPKPKPAGAKKRPSKSRKEMARVLPHVLPSSVDEVEDTLLLLEHLYSFDRAKLLACKQGITDLLADEMALVEYLLQELCDDDQGDTRV